MMRVYLHEIKLLLSFSAMKTSHSHGIVATFECYHVNVNFHSYGLDSLLAKYVQLSHN